jgi:tetratricopeptide (TPR) repeat protein
MDAARAALEFVARGEVYAPLAALWYLRLAELEPESRAKLRALNQAVACAPGLDRVRLRRLEERAFVGDVDGVLADAEHLEAAAKGSRARHDVLRRAAQVLLTRGYVRDAGKIFERALRYVPDDAESTAGLGRSFIEIGDFRRAIVLLERAIALGSRSGRPKAPALIDLARVLAEEMGDLPQAIARVREVTGESSEASEARALEASWRARLGDIAGASLAYARLRQQLELSPPARKELAVEWLERAADFERDVQRDLSAAERHLAALLRLVPHDVSAQEAYRAVAVRLAAEGHRTLPAHAAIEPQLAPERLANEDV